MKPALLSSGITTLNLASSGKTTGLIRKGHFFHFVGDSSSGKSWLAVQLIAEAVRNPEFDDYQIIYDDSENGALVDIDIEKFFGKATADRIKIIHLGTVEELYDYLDDLHQSGKPFLFIEDSMDALTCDADEAKFQENKKARKKGKKTSGSYGVEKAKINSTNLRTLANKKLPKTGSILVIISQTRDNIGFGFETKTRAGGKALHFYAHLSVWSSIVKTLTKKVNDIDRIVGNTIRLQIKKNRVSGRYARVDVDFKFHYGFDDTASCIKFLIEEKHWKKSGGKINAVELGLVGTETKLPALIEKKKKTKELKKVVLKVWKEVEAQLKVEREPRYS